MEIVNTTGRRKTSVARLYLTKGKGEVIINKKPLVEYFPDFVLQHTVLQPLELLEKTTEFDLKVNLDGGGGRGQAEALRMAIARALVKVDPEHRVPLKAAGFLMRDARQVERKKPGQPKARKRFQFSKR